MRLLIIAHAGWRHTGYGVPVLPLVRELRKHGHEAAVLAVEERGPGVVEYRGVRHYLPFRRPYGEDVVRAVMNDFRAEAVISIIDPWVFSPTDALAGLNWMAWCAVDQEPPAPGLLSRLGHAARVLPFSEWGAGVVRAAGISADALPIGIETKVFKPAGAEARERLRESSGLPAGGALRPFDRLTAQGAFVVGMVGAYHAPDRKALKENIAGFCQFAEGHPEAYLLLWCAGAGGMVDEYKQALSALRPSTGSGAGGREAQDIAERVMAVSEWQVMYGGRPEELAGFYGMLDVLLQASAGEGFGLPILEAMACGVPAIGAANSSMTELIPERVGWLVPESELRREWSAAGGGWWRRPTADGVAAALEAAYEALRDEGVRKSIGEDCRGWAMGFDWEIVGERWEEQISNLKNPKSQQ